MSEETHEHDEIQNRSFPVNMDKVEMVIASEIQTLQMVIGSISLAPHMNSSSPLDACCNAHPVCFIVQYK